MSKLTFFAGAVALLLAVPSSAALIVSKAPTQNVDCTAGTCTATAADAVLNLKDLKTQLAAGDLTLKAGSDAADIVVAGKFKWINPHRLTLDAFHSVIFTKAVTVEGSGAVTITPNDGGSSGDLVFTGKGKLGFWDLSSSLVIAGQPYTLIGDIAGLAGAVAADPAGHYALAGMYDGQGASYADAAVQTDFSGTFTGLGHMIANVQILCQGHKAYCGLLRGIEASGTVRDLVLQNVTVLATKFEVHGAVGALAAQSDGLISNVAVVDGSVDARAPRSDAQVGSIVGENTGVIA